MIKIETDMKEGYMKATVKGDAPQIFTEIAIALRDIYKEMAKDDETGYLFKRFVEDGVLEAIVVGDDEKIIETVVKAMAKDEKDVQH